MKQKIIGMTLALMLSATGWAQGVSGFSYTQIGDDDITVGALVGSVGYRFELNDNISLIPELRGGFGIKNDTFLGSEIKLKGLFAGALRAELQVGEPVYFFASASYGRYRVKANLLGGGSIDVADDESGFGGGIGFNVGDTGSIEVGYEDLGGLDAFSVGVRFEY